jgi:hypothetical protein
VHAGTCRVRALPRMKSRRVLGSAAPTPDERWLKTALESPQNSAHADVRRAALLCTPVRVPAQSESGRKNDRRRARRAGLRFGNRCKPTPKAPGRRRSGRQSDHLTREPSSSRVSEVPVSALSLPCDIARHERDHKGAEAVAKLPPTLRPPSREGRERGRRRTSSPGRRAAAPRSSRAAVGEGDHDGDIFVSSTARACPAGEDRRRAARGGISGRAPPPRRGQGAAEHRGGAAMKTHEERGVTEG